MFLKVSKLVFNKVSKDRLLKWISDINSENNTQLQPNISKVNNILTEFINFQISHDGTKIVIIWYKFNDGGLKKVGLWNFDINIEQFNNDNLKKEIQVFISDHNTYKTVRLKYENKVWLIQEGTFVAIKRTKNKETYYKFIKKWDIIWKDFGLSTIKWEINSQWDLLMLISWKWNHWIRIKTFIDNNWIVLRDNFFDEYYRDKAITFEAPFERYEGNKSKLIKPTRVPYMIGSRNNKTYLDENFNQVYPFYFRDVLYKNWNYLIWFPDDVFWETDVIFTTTKFLDSSNNIKIKLVIIVNGIIENTFIVDNEYLENEVWFTAKYIKYWVVIKSSHGSSNIQNVITAKKSYKVKDYMRKHIHWNVNITWFKLDTWKWLLSDLKEYSWNIKTIDFDNTIYWYMDKDNDIVYMPKAIEQTEDRLHLVEIKNIFFFKIWISTIWLTDNGIVYFEGDTHWWDLKLKLIKWLPNLSGGKKVLKTLSGWFILLKNWQNKDAWYINKIPGEKPNTKFLWAYDKYYHKQFYNWKEYIDILVLEDQYGCAIHVSINDNIFSKSFPDAKIETTKNNILGISIEYLWKKYTVKVLDKKLWNHLDSNDIPEKSTEIAKDYVYLVPTIENIAKTNKPKNWIKVIFHTWYNNYNAWDVVYLSEDNYDKIRSLWNFVVKYEDFEKICKKVKWKNFDKENKDCNDINKIKVIFYSNFKKYKIWDIECITLDKFDELREEDVCMEFEKFKYICSNNTNTN